MDDERILTLEPLIAAVERGMRETAWTLSGLQKTTSHQFEGRWAGDSTRSAYLFFHDETRSADVSIDVFLDETSRGLRGNLALVLDGRSTLMSHRVDAVLERARSVARTHLSRLDRSSVVVRLQADSASRTDPPVPGIEVRFKIHIPRASIDGGGGAVSALTTETVEAYQRLLEDPSLGELCPLE